MKVVACDFDNTLYVKDKDIFTKNLEQIKTFIDKGNIFIIITGRSFTNINNMIKEYNIPYNFLVCQDGATIFDNKGNCLKTNFLDKEKSKKIESYLIQNKIPYNFESAFNDNDIIDNAVKITITINSDIDSNKILTDIKQIEKVYAYISSKHINVIDDYINKSKAIDYLIANNYISNNISVIGDDINDYEMLLKYDGVVMKKHDFILDPLNKPQIDTVYEYLEKII